MPKLNETAKEDVPKRNTLTNQAFATDYDLKNERKTNELILTTKLTLRI